MIFHWQYRTDTDAMRAILLRAPAGEQVALDQVAIVGVTRGPEKIEREERQRRIVVMSNVRGRDLGSIVAEIRAKLDRQIALPPGYFIDYGGQFENQQRAMSRLSLIVPIAIAAIFVLFYFTFASVKQALLVVGNVPWALVGGIAALWIRGMNLDLSASVGFIALFGVAMLNGVVLVSSINTIASGRRARALRRICGRSAQTSPRVDDCLRCQYWIYPYGRFDFHWSRSAAAPRVRRDWRFGELNPAYTFLAAYSIRTDFPQGRCRPSPSA